METLLFAWILNAVWQVHLPVTVEGATAVFL